MPNRSSTIFGSATETFAQKNLNRSLDEQFAMFEPVVRRARDAGLDVRAYVSMCFGDPWEGAVPIEQVVGVGKRLFDLGASQLSLGDTIGVGTAGHVGALVESFAAAGMSRGDLKELGEQLDSGEAGLVVVGVSDMEAKIEAAMKKAEKVSAKEIKADQKAIEEEAKEADSAS